MLTTLLLLAAHPAPPAPPAPPPAPPMVREIVILRDGKDAAAAPKPGERREVRIIRRGAEGGRTPPLAIERCQGEAVADIDRTEPSADGKQQRTRILVCSASGATSVGQAQHLRDTIKRIEGDKSLSDETRTRVIAALNAAIAALPVQE